MVDVALLQLLRGRVHRGHVALGAHDDADDRGVDVEALELRLDLGLDLWLAHAAMSVRSCRPSKAIMSAAAYAAARAAGTPSASAVTLSTRPPAVTIAPSRSAVPAWVTSTPSGTRSRPEISSPEELDSG